MTRIHILTTCVIALALTACNNSDKDFDATGTFEVTEVIISAKATGTLTSFNVAEGHQIDAFEVVGHLDDTQLRLQKQQLESHKTQLDANRRQLGANKGATNSRQLDLDKQVASLKQQIANAKRERERYNAMLRDGAVPRKQVDEINYQISVLEKQLAATQDQLQSNNASLAQQSAGIDAQIEGINAQSTGIDRQIAQIDDQIANTIIASPIAGNVIEKYVEQGEFVTIGKPLFKVADTEHVLLRAYVTSAQLERIKVGQAVKVTTDYGNKQGKSYEGTITWISSRSEFTPKTIVTEDERADLVYAVKVAVKGGNDIKMGMYGKLKF